MNMRMRFNRSNLLMGATVPLATQEAIEQTPTLRQASLNTALRYGGKLTQQAIEKMDITFSRKHVVVDTKVHFLMPGWSPSIPGWHTDGVPRGDELNPAGTGIPHIEAQEGNGFTAPIYHLLVLGNNSLTQFIRDRNIQIEVPDEPTRDLYTKITQSINGAEFEKFSIPEGQIVTWDWWEVHSASWATARGWRYLIRVTETDYIEPRTSLDDILRFQNVVFTSSDEVGW